MEYASMKFEKVIDYKKNVFKDCLKLLIFEVL